MRSALGVTVVLAIFFVISDSRIIEYNDVPGVFSGNPQASNWSPLYQEYQQDNVGRACAKIGQFCVYHDDCCTKACLGYMRRCVYGGPLRPDE